MDNRRHIDTLDRFLDGAAKKENGDWNVAIYAVRSSGNLGKLDPRMAKTKRLFDIGGISSWLSPKMA